MRLSFLFELLFAADAFMNGLSDSDMGGADATSVMGTICLVLHLMLVS